MLKSSIGIILPAISAPFTVYQDDTDNIWLYAGTGRFQVSSDKTDSAQNYLLGVKDPFYNRRGVPLNTTTPSKPTCYHLYDNTPGSGACALTPDDLFRAFPYTIKPDRIVQPSNSYCNIDSSGTPNCYAEAGISSLTTWDALLAEVKKKTGTPAYYEFYQGWQRKLQLNGTSPSERVVNKPTIFGGIALFPTYMPSSNTCSYGGSSNLYALYYATGTAYRKPVLTGLNNTVKIQDTFFLGYGLSSSFGIHAGKEKGDSATVYSQMSTGLINEIAIDPAIATRSGMEYWKEGR
jgi:type IV pilus assembly protein PilY1